MKRKILAGIFLTVSLLTTIFIVAAQSLVTSPAPSQVIMSHGTGGYVYVDLPSNASYPKKPGGTPDHPTQLQFMAYDYDKTSTDGAGDVLLLFMWDPKTENISPILAVTDNAAMAAHLKTFWNGTYMWYQLASPINIPGVGVITNLFPNIIQVAPEELEVEAVSTPSQLQNSRGRFVWDQYGHYVWKTDIDVVLVNLNKAVNVTLPAFTVNSTGPNPTANLSFTLPKLTLTLREISEGFYDEETLKATGWPGASGWTRMTHEIHTPAYAMVSIPDWLHGLKIETMGHIGQQFVGTTTPP